MFNLIALLVAAALPIEDDNTGRLSALEACTKIINAADRLACYDKAMGLAKTSAAVKQPTVKQVQQVQQVEAETAASPLVKPAPIVRKIKPDEAKKLFGKSPSKTQPPIPNQITAQVAAISKNTSGKLLFKMQDGSRWIQRDSRYFKKKDAPFEVIIKKGFAGSYLLRYPDSNRSIKVKRID